MSKLLKPTDAELEVLQVLWSKGPSSVRTVHEALSEHKSTFYTTTLKTMQVMLDKGLLDRDTSARSHIYSSNVSQGQVQRSIVSRIKDTVFGGSMSQLIISAIGQDRPTKEELDKIKSMIDKLEQDD